MSKLSQLGVQANRPPWLVAELSGNHRGRLEEALALVDAAAKAGADAVKLQTYTADTLTLPCAEPPFLAEGLWEGECLYELYQKASTPWDWHPELERRARALGLTVFSSPFDETAVDFLESSCDMPLYKIASFECAHLPLLRRVAQTKKPVLMSVGMAEEAEIAQAVETLRSGGCPEIVLLKCVSAYPADPKDFNLRAMQTLAERFGCMAGLSDHTLSHEVALGATALGARVIEKHLTLDRGNGAVDNGFSLEPAEFAEMARATRSLFGALGEGRIGPGEAEKAQRRFRRSIFVSAPIAVGETLTEQNLKIVRPADGLSPSEWERALGRTATRALAMGQPLRAGDFE